MPTKTTRSVGRPPAEVRFPRTAFTIDAVHAINPKVCKLTIRNKVNEGLASKKLVKLAKNVETDSAGRPAFRFMLKSRVKSVAKVKSPKASPAPVVAETAPVAQTV